MNYESCETKNYYFYNISKINHLVVDISVLRKKDDLYKVIRNEKFASSYPVSLMCRFIYVSSNTTYTQFSLTINFSSIAF